MGKMRPLKLETLVDRARRSIWRSRRMMFVAASADRLGRDRVVVGLLIGAAVGWQRGKMMHIHVDPETHALNQKASPAAMFFLIALIVVRSGARAACSAHEAQRQPGDADRSADRLRARHVHAAAGRDVPARQAPARGGARPRLMSERALLRGAGGGRAPLGARGAAQSRADRRSAARMAAASAAWCSRSPAAPASTPSHFAERFPDARMAAERRPSRRAGLDRRVARRRAACRISRPPLVLDAASPDWPIERADAVLSINMVHISPWASALGLLDGAARLLATGAPLILYGPWLSDDIPTAPSNLAFDADLKRRDPEWGLRRVEEFAAAADERGLRARRNPRDAGEQSDAAVAPLLGIRPRGCAAPVAGPSARRRDRDRTSERLNAMP